MKVFLLKDVEKVGFAGEIIKVKEGFAYNFLIPQKLGAVVTEANEKFYLKQLKNIENRKEAISTKTSMLAEKIKTLKLVIKRKMHDDDKLYASISPSDIVDLLSNEGIKVSKAQIVFDKPIKTQGSYEVTIKLSNQLMPKIGLKVVSDK